MNKNVVTHIPLEVFASGSLTGAYKVINVDGFAGSLNYIRIENTMDVAVMISFDGTDNHEYVLLHDHIDVPYQACSSPTNKRSLLRKGTKVYVKKANNFPKSGAVIISGWYQD